MVQAKEEVKPEPEPEPDVPDDDFGDFDLDNGDDGCMWGDLLGGGDEFTHSAYGEEAPMRQPPEAADPQAEIAKLHAQQTQEVYDGAMARKLGCSHLRLCVCVCACVRERERERDRARGALSWGCYVAWGLYPAW